MTRHLLISLIRLYQRLLSPWLGPVCRFEPSCSRYAVAAIENHGAAWGSLLSLSRLCKCHPFHPGGFDPPPQRGAPLSVRQVLFAAPKSTSFLPNSHGRPNDPEEKPAAAAVES